METTKFCAAEQAFTSDMSYYKCEMICRHVDPSVDQIPPVVGIYFCFLVLPVHIFSCRALFSPFSGDSLCRDGKNHLQPSQPLRFRMYLFSLLMLMLFLLRSCSRRTTGNRATVNDENGELR